MPKGRALRTVVFVDVVGSTEVIAELGDDAWRRIAGQMHALLRSGLRRHRGHEVDTAGDGLFATFDAPVEGVSFAHWATGAVQSLGIQVRTGVHFGEVELADGKPHGIAVHAGARIMALAGPGEVLVSTTVRDLVAGSLYRLEERGQHDLKGVPGSWVLFEATPVDGALAEPLSREEAASRRLAAAGGGGESRRPRWLVPAAALAILAMVGATVALVGNDDRKRSAEKPPRQIGNTLIRIDAEDHDWFPIPGFASSSNAFFDTSPAVGLGAVWLLDGPSVRKVDLDTLVQDNPIALPGGGGFSIAVSFGKIWVAQGSNLQVIDPAAERSTTRLSLPQAPPGGVTQVSSMTAGLDAVWIGWSDGSVIRIDPETRQLDRTSVEGSINDLAAGTKELWIATAEGDLFVLDRSGRPPQRINVGGTPQSVAVGNGRVWVVDSITGVLTVVDEQTKQVRGSVGVGTAPVDVAFGLGAVWIGDAKEDAVHVIDPQSEQEIGDPIAIGAPVIGVAIDEEHGVLWAALGGARRTPTRA